MEVPEEVKQDIVAFQNLQNQLQLISYEKQQVSALLTNIENAKREVGEAGEGVEIYRAVGPVLVRKDKESVIKWLDSQKELAEIRLKTLEKQEEKIKNQLLALKKKIEEKLPKEGAYVG